MHHHGRRGRKATKEHGDHRNAQQNISPLDLAALIFLLVGLLVGSPRRDTARRCR
jgi:hypothetical protein